MAGNDIKQSEISRSSQNHLADLNNSINQRLTEYFHSIINCTWSNVIHVVEDL